MTSLKRLDLSNNKITRIGSGAFSHLVECKELSLWKNHLVELNKGMFQGLRSLKKLDVSENSIALMDSGTFLDLVNCLELNLGKNKLKNINNNIWIGLSRLYVLSLSGNQLNYLTENMFKGLSSLRELHLSDNGIIYLEPFALASLPNLKDISFYSNNLTTLTKDIFNPKDYPRSGGHPPELELILSGNPIKCDSRMDWIKQGEREGWITWYTRENIDHSPECVNYRGVKWSQVSLKNPVKG